MKKKLIYGLVMPLLAVVLVSAAILSYYAIFGVTLNITQQITVNDKVIPYEETLPTVNCNSGGLCIGDVLKISNNGDNDRTITVTTNENCEEIVNTAYVGKLLLTKKDITTWSAIESPIEITYTVVGDTFKATGIPEGYTLIYYKDKGDYTTDAQRLTVLGENIPFNGNMPSEDDWNAGQYADYCNNGIDNYLHCKGAKLWAVPNGNIVDGALVWSNPENFYFETDLITYTESNLGIINVLVPAESFITIYPAFNIEGLAYGTCSNVTITVA